MLSPGLAAWMNIHISNMGNTRAFSLQLDFQRLLLYMFIEIEMNPSSFLLGHLYGQKASFLVCFDGPFYCTTHFLLGNWVEGNFS